MSWWVYMLRCGDDSLYTGVARDPAARLRSLAAGRGARYTRGRGPLRLVYQDGPLEHAEALQRERAIKRLTRKQKLALVEGRPEATSMGGCARRLHPS